MKTVESKQVLLRVPVQLLKKLDAAASAQRRSRTAEACVRLKESLQADKATGPKKGATA